MIYIVDIYIGALLADPTIDLLAEIPPLTAYRVPELEVIRGKYLTFPGINEDIFLLTWISTFHQ